MANNDGDRVARYSESLSQIVYRGLYFLIFSLTPEAPRHLWINFRWSAKREFIAVCLVATLFFSIVLNIGFSAIEGRLWPDPDRTQYNFLEDYANLILYAVVVPGYVTLCFLLAGEASVFWAGRIQARRETASLTDKIRPIRFGLALFVTLFVAALSIGNYQYDLVYADTLDFQYWFIDKIVGVPVPNRAGFYYLILNFALLTVTLLGAMSYFSIAFETVADAKREVAGTLQSAEDIDELIRRYSPFFTSVVYCRLLVFFYILNLIVWRYSPLGVATNANVTLAVLMLLLLGVLGTIVPARIIEKKVAIHRDECLQRGLDVSKLGKLPRIERWMGRFANIVSFFISWEFVFLIYPDLEPVENAIRWLAALLDNV